MLESWSGLVPKRYHAYKLRWYSQTGHEVGSSEEDQGKSTFPCHMNHSWPSATAFLCTIISFIHLATSIFQFLCKQPSESTHKALAAAIGSTQYELLSIIF